MRLQVAPVAVVAHVAAAASFALTNVSGAPAAIIAISGSGQAAPVGTPYGALLVVRVADAFGNPVAGTAVTFALAGSGGAGWIFTRAATVPTAADGTATLMLPAITVPRPFTVTEEARSGRTGAGQRLRPRRRHSTAIRWLPLMSIWYTWGAS